MNLAVALCPFGSSGSVGSEVNAPGSSCDRLCHEIMLHGCALVAGLFGMFFNVLVK